MDDADAAIQAGGRRVAAGRAAHWARSGLRLYRRQPGAWLACSATLCSVLALAAAVPLPFLPALHVLTPALSAGLVLACSAVEAGGRAHPLQIFEGIRRASGPLLALGVFALLADLLAQAAVAACLGSWQGASAVGGISKVALSLRVVFCAPALLALWFAPALVLLNRLSAPAALRASLLAGVRSPLAVGLHAAWALGLVALAAAPSWLRTPTGAALPFAPVWTTVLMSAVTPWLAGSVYAASRDIFGRPARPSRPSLRS